MAGPAQMVPLAGLGQQALHGSGKKKIVIDQNQ